MGKVAIIDYGCGNIFSVENAVKSITRDYIITSSVRELDSVDKIILPGVGSFRLAMENLATLGLDVYIKEYCQKGKAILGICLGMQLLLNKSYEHGETEGLGLINGDVVPFLPTKQYRVPHIGWNDVHFETGRNPEFMEGVDSGTAFYFVHSYYCDLDEDISSIYVNYCEKNIVVGLKKNNVSGVQFHPEKSQDAGIKLLRNFIMNEPASC